MSDTGNNIVLEHLRHIRAVVDETRLDIKELKTRVGFLEQRIENRIGLVEA
jgi:hypothetical protein